MKKTLCITTLCAITALFSGCWKKKDKTDTMNSAMSTDAIMSDDKPIKVAALAEMSPGGNAAMTDVMSTGPSDQNKLGDSTNDEPAIKEAGDADKEAVDADKEAVDAEEKADEAMDGAKAAIDEAKAAIDDAVEAKDEADDAEEKADKAMEKANKKSDKKADSAGKKKK